MQDAEVVARIQRKFRLLQPEKDERMRRQWAASEARDMGWGGMTAVARATGMSRATIAAGVRDLELPVERRTLEAGRVRRPGAGRRPLVETDPELFAALEALIEPGTRGDPRVALAMDLQKHTTAGGGVDAAGSSGRRKHGGRLAA
jgi:hypothetical protein